MDYKFGRHFNLEKRLKLEIYDTWQEYYYYNDDSTNYKVFGSGFEVSLSNGQNFLESDVSIFWENLKGNIKFNSNIEDFEKCIIPLSGLNFIIKYNNHYKCWENSKSPDTYKYKGGLEIYFSETFQIKMVDLSDRPGRSSWKKDFYFNGGSDYWFNIQYINELCDINIILP